MHIFGGGRNDKAAQPWARPNLDYTQLPNVGRDYDPNLKMSYEEQLKIHETRAQQAYSSQGFVHCPTHGQGKIVFACAHCAEQDPVHPRGMIFSPFKYFLCNDCYGEYRLHSFDFAHKLAVTCYFCIVETWQRIVQDDPKKCVNMFEGPDAIKPNHGLFK